MGINQPLAEIGLDTLAQGHGKQPVKIALSRLGAHHRPVESAQQSHAPDEGPKSQPLKPGAAHDYSPHSPIKANVAATGSAAFVIGRPMTK